MGRRYGIIGRPLGHSFSPRYFGDKFRREGIDARYDRFELQDIDEVGRLLEEHPDLVGFNVTIPYKQQIIPLLSALSPEAAAIGAVNCVRVERLADGSPRLTGYNTDARGFRQSLLEFIPDLTPVPGQEGQATEENNPVCLTGRTARSNRFPHLDSETGLEVLPGNDIDGQLPPGSPSPPHPTPNPAGITGALVLGNGGAARAVRYVLETLGIPHLTVSRHPRGEGEIGYPDIDGALLDSHPLLVNTTPLGMSPNTGTCPDLPYALLGPRHYLHDLVYNPEITEFLLRGAHQGAHVRNGLRMLYLQADESWRIWTSAPLRQEISE